MAHHRIALIPEDGIGAAPRREKTDTITRHSTGAVIFLTMEMTCTDWANPNSSGNRH